MLVIEETTLRAFDRVSRFRKSFVSTENRFRTMKSSIFGRIGSIFVRFVCKSEISSNSLVRFLFEMRVKLSKSIEKTSERGKSRVPRSILGLPLSFVASWWQP